jgi:5'-3' exoribonuclease 1
MVASFAVTYQPSGMVARQLRLNPRVLGRITGNVWVGLDGDERVDVGLAIKNAKQGLCVPGERGGGGGRG